MEVVAGVVEDAAAAVGARGAVGPLAGLAREAQREQDRVGLLYDAPEPLGDRGVLEPPAAHHLYARLVGGALEPPGLGDGHGRGLLDEDVLAGAGGLDGEFGVGVVGGADGDGVHLVVGEHLVEVGRPVLHLALLGALAGGLLAYVHGGVDVYLGGLEHVAQVGPADAAASDDCDV